MKIFRLGLLLFLIGLVSSVLLGYVYSLTEKVIEERRRADWLRQQEEIFPAATNFSEVSIDTATGKNIAGIYRANDEKNELVGYLGKVYSPGYGGNITILVGVIPNGRVEKVRILSENETPGLGKGISKDSFLKQFSARALPEIFLSKFNPAGKIDSLNGASRSSRAVVKGIQNLGKYLKDAGLISEEKKGHNVSN
jgi:electron transport complex protein RnfG